MSDLPEQRKSTPVEYDKLNDVQKMYVRRFERYNRSRAKGVKNYLGIVRNMGIATVSVAVGTYLYTIFAMKQITLGPEFDQRASDVETADKSKNN